MQASGFAAQLTCSTTCFICVHVMLIVYGRVTRHKERKSYAHRHAVHTYFLFFGDRTRKCTAQCLIPICLAVSDVLYVIKAF